MAGLFVISRIVVMPRSTRICDPMPYSRESAGKPELLVRLDGVAALVLERVRAQLVAEADAAALVPAQVHDDALTLRRDLLERGVELQAAVAAHRAEHVAGEALASAPGRARSALPATSPRTNAMCSTPSSRLSNT